MQHATDTKIDTKRLWDLIKDIKVAMMSSIHDGDLIRSRPMFTQQVEFDGDLWFFTDDTEGGKSKEIRMDHRVNLSYANPSKQSYVSVSGHASMEHNAEKIRELWNPLYKAWFPKGLDDPSLALLKVTVEKAEIWDSPPGKVVQLIGFSKAVLTGKSFKGEGQNQKFDFAASTQP